MVSGRNEMVSGRSEMASGRSDQISRRRVFFKDFVFQEKSNMAEKSDCFLEKKVHSRHAHTCRHLTGHRRTGSDVTESVQQRTHEGVRATIRTDPDRCHGIGERVQI